MDKTKLGFLKMKHSIEKVFPRLNARTLRYYKMIAIVYQTYPEVSPEVGVSSSYSTKFTGNSLHFLTRDENKPNIYEYLAANKPIILS